MSSGQITIAFLDVGQGDSTVAVLPDRSSAVVVDCPSPTTIDYLEDKGIHTLSYVFLTHTDLDHIGAAARLLENFGQVEAIAYNHDTPLVGKGKRKIILQHLAQQLRQRSIRPGNPRRGQEWLLQGVAINVLHPDEWDIRETELRGDTNNASILLAIAFAGRRVLLAADIAAQGWQWIVERGESLQADVFKYPHHGAWYEPKENQPSLDQILHLVNPKLVILSVGSYNTYNHPHFKTFRILRAYPHLRFVCTQATPQCQGLLSETDTMSCPCAGTIEVTIGDQGITIVPDSAKHLEIINQFDSPQCLVNRASEWEWIELQEKHG